MSRDMSWRSAASSKFNSLKGYVAQRANTPGTPAGGTSTPQGWKSWAVSQIPGRGQNSSSTIVGENRISLFPGWATRRYAASGEGFEIDVVISGFAAIHTPPELASRSQRAFMRLAKGFAALPKLAAEAAEAAEGVAHPPIPLTPSTEQLLKTNPQPPRPEEITEELEIQALEHQFRRASAETNESEDSEDDEVLPPSLSRSSSFSSLESASTPPSLPEELRRLHANFESRLQPFWSSALSSRTIRLSLFTATHKPSLHSTEPDRADEEDSEMAHEALVVQEVVTSADGSFQARFRVPYEKLCQHPGALHIAFGEPTEEHELLVHAEVSAPLVAYNESTDDVTRVVSPPKTVSTSLRVSLTHAPVRCISDIDDTLKYANVLDGARAVFYTVFVRELKDIVIPGMPEWYTSMWKRGVRFHYVSNGPFALLPVVNEFFAISDLPPGSIKLKSYGGRSIFNGLLSAPAARKKAGISEIIDAFPHAQFLLVGDSGEQDLELYANFAAERPKQILGVFVRDVTADSESVRAVDDPTGWGVQDVMTPKSTQDTPQPSRYRIRSRAPSSLSVKTPDSSGGGDYFMPSSPSPMPVSPTTPNSAGAVSSTPYRVRQQPSRTASMASTVAHTMHVKRNSVASDTSTVSSISIGDAPKTLSPEEKKRWELQARIHRARTIMPSHVPLRVFRHPDECVEAKEILNRLNVGKGTEV